MATSSKGPGRANLGEIAAQRPVGDARGWLWNQELEEGDQYMDFHFRPEPIKEQITVNYAKMPVIGMSHQYQSYSHTNNMVIGFDLYMNRLMAAKDGAISSTRSEREQWRDREYAKILQESTSEHLFSQSERIERSRRFLEALTVPAENFTGLVAPSPPAVILWLPGVVVMRCRLTSLSIDFEAVDIEGNLKEVRCRVKFEEAPFGRITMQDVFANGSFRSWGEGEY